MITPGVTTLISGIFLIADDRGRQTGSEAGRHAHHFRRIGAEQYGHDPGEFDANNFRPGEFEREWRLFV